MSDATWKVRKADAWADDLHGDTAGPAGGGVPIEVFDARRFPYGWQEARFDDSDWGTAFLVPAVHVGGFARTQPV